MGDFLIGIGFLLAIFGPLLLVPVTWLLYRFAVRSLVGRVAPQTLSAGNARWFAWSVSTVIVAGALVVSYLPGLREFEQLCSQHATPAISSQVQTKGFYRTRLFSYEAARYLAGESFEFVEAPHPYQQDALVRYSKGADGEVTEELVPGISSAYGVRQTFSQPSGSITMTEKVIYEIETNRELARAASIHYRGGPLSLFLGTHGMSSCPDIVSEEGSRQFRTFYNLESIILRAEPLP